MLIDNIWTAFVRCELLIFIYTYELKGGGWHLYIVRMSIKTICILFIFSMFKAYLYALTICNGIKVFKLFIANIVLFDYLTRDGAGDLLAGLCVQRLMQ